MDGISFETRNDGSSMKTLVFAIICFILVLWGSYDVHPFKAIKRVLKRTPSKPATGPLRRTGHLPPEPTYRGLPERRRHY
jgi:hypothetical protein